MIFDTDVLVWAERGNENALDVISEAAEPAISIFTYMELLQGARNKKEVEGIRSFLEDGHFQVHPLTDNIGHRALVYIEAHAGPDGLRASDAVIAATAVEFNSVLVSGNYKHYKVIQQLNLQPFRHS